MTRMHLLHFLTRHLLGLGLFALTAGVVPTTAGAQDAAIRPSGPAVEKPLHGGQHFRIAYPKMGAVHVWVPKGYVRKTAGIVVYLHGYHTTVDKAFVDHKLAEQFSKSRQNAIFIVPACPAGKEEGVVWTSLSQLKKSIQAANIRLPDGETVVAAHSGGFRTVRHWTDNRLLKQIILLDAMYGGFNEFKDFIATGARAAHRRMILVTADTDTQTRRFTREFNFAVTRTGVPADFTGFTSREKKSRLLYIKSQYDHYAIITSMTVLPVLLRLTPLRLLP